MKTKITISLIAIASFLFAEQVAKAQSTAGNNTYNALNYIGWNTAGGDLPFKINTTMMTLKNTTGYLGIGTTTPLGTLDVQSAQGAHSWTYLRGNVNGTKPSTSFSGGGLGIGFSYAGTCEVDFVTGPADCAQAGGYRFQRWDAGGSGTITDLVTIQAGGNTGIGTTSPTSILHTVATGAKTAAYSGNFLTNTATSSTASINKTGLEVTSTGTWNGTSASNIGLYVSSVSGGTKNYDAIFNGGGNVGIGITSPSYKTEIVHTAAADGSDAKGLKITATASTVGSAKSYGLWVNASGSDDGNYSAVFENGNVGVGLTNPAAKLDVNGTSNFTGAMGITGNVTVTGSGTYSGTWVSSDQQFKTDVDSLHDALTVIRQLKPKTYYFDTVNFSEFNFSSEKSYGFIAQEIEQILPELVSSNLKPAVLDTSGNVIHPAVSYKAVNYTELIAFLTKGIQELQQKNDGLQSKASNQDSINTALQSNNITLQNQVNQLVANGTLMQNQLNQLLDAVNNCCSATRSIQTGSTNTQSEPIMQTDVKLRNGQALVLQQNVPNPFKENTTINYILPESYMKAQLLFNNSQGKLIQSVELTGSGEGQLNVFADDLSSGIYTYTLVVDGKIIETKKMIKQ